MLTLHEGAHERQASKRTPMPQLLEEAEVVATPRGPHGLVLRLVGDLKTKYDEPVRHEALRWVADDAPRTSDPEGSLAALDDALGPRSRQGALLEILGDLVDMGLLRQDLTGLYVTGAGTAALHTIEGLTPSFTSVI